MTPNPKGDGWWSRVGKLWGGGGAATPDPSLGVQEERQLLKAALQRKRRNDRVRHNELNALRVLIEQKQAQSRTGEATSALFAATGMAAGGGDKSRTIEQIARIEQQMAQHWTPKSIDAGGQRVGPSTHLPGRLEGSVAPSAHLQARSDRPTGFAMTIDVVTEDPHALTTAAEPELAHPSVADAAVRFANGQIDETRAAVQALIAQEVRSPLGRMAGWMMLDLCCATGDVEGFEEAAVEMAERFGLPLPRWPGTGPKPSAPVAAESPAVSGHELRWICPALLEARDVIALREASARQGGEVWLDWTDLISADLPAAAELVALVNDWRTQPRQMHVRGGAVLRRRLKASTPSGRRENDPIWWQLRLSFLQWMGRREEFDLVALDYCVTYGELPPEWVAPLCRCESAEEWPEPPAGTSPTAAAPAPVGPSHLPASGDGHTPAAPADAPDWPALPTVMAPGETQFPALPTMVGTHWETTMSADAGAQVSVSGVLQGDIAPVLADLDRARDACPPDRLLIIDARHLHRMDFAAAGGLLQWLMGSAAAGRSVELRGVSRLVAAFFHVVGIDEAVTVRLRQY